MVEVAGSAIPGAKPAAPNAAPSDPSKTSGAAKVSAPFQITAMKDRDRWLKMIIYGKHGAGKTELAGSAVDVPQMRDVVMIDAESGDMTLHDSTRIKNPDLMHHIRVTSFSQVAYVQEFLKAYCSARDRGDIKTMSKLYFQVTGVQTDTPPNYRTVIVDSLTEVEVYCVYQLLKINPESTHIGDDIDTAGWPEFRKNNEMVKLMVRAFRDLPMHVIFVCAESYTQDEQKKHHYSPALTGKLASQVQGFVDIVGWITVGQSDGKEEAPRRVFIQPISGGPKFDAKNRRSVYKAPFFDNPSMMSIMKDVGLLE
jgi:hypothetical protein